MNIEEIIRKIIKEIKYEIYILREISNIKRTKVKQNE